MVDLLGAMKVYKTELIRQQGPGGRSSRSSLRPSNTCDGGTMSGSTGNSICVLRSRSNRRTTLKPRRFCHRPADRETGRNKNQANPKCFFLPSVETKAPVFERMQRKSCTQLGLHHHRHRVHITDIAITLRHSWIECVGFCFRLSDYLEFRVPSAQAFGVC